MQQGPSWEANRSLASQETPRIIWNPNAHYRVHNGPPLFPVLSEISSLYAILFLEDPFQYYLYTYVQVFQVVDFPPASSSNSYTSL